MPQFSARFETSYRVRFDEAGANGLLPASGLLRYAQDVAWQHSEGAGFDRAWYAERGLTWLVRSAQLELLAPIQYGAELRISTEIVGFRRVWARRLSEVCANAGGPLAARLLIDWVILGPRGAPVRVPREITDPLPEIPSLSPLRVVLDGPNGVARRAELAVQRRDLDPMVHVNNAAYVDYLDDSVATAGGIEELDRFPRRYVVEYVASAEGGARLTSLTWRSTNGGWAYRLTDADAVHTELFRGRLD
ncbi:MAG: hypothetical protein H0X16_06930 [Chloroflexi bacterium]|nr:hypothetical protein [Chloroflexota bacterium]